MTEPKFTRGTAWAPWLALADAPSIPTSEDVKPTLFTGAQYVSVGDAREIFQGDHFRNELVGLAINGDVAARLVHAANCHAALLAALTEVTTFLRGVNTLATRGAEIEISRLCRNSEAAIAKAEGGAV